MRQGDDLGGREPGRAGVATGVGFVGAGTILKSLVGVALAMQTLSVLGMVERRTDPR